MLALLHILDILTAATLIVGPWLLWGIALIPFRKVLRREWLPILVVAGLVVGFFLFSFNVRTETFSQAMIHSNAKLWHSAQQENITAGRAPLWMDSLGVGLPALANPFHSFASPLSAVFLGIEDDAVALNIYLIAHLALAAVNTYLLSRSLGVGVFGSMLSSIPYVFNAWVFRRLDWEIHAKYLLAYAWLPLFWSLLILYLRNRRLTTAALSGIPLAFIAIGLPTIFTFISLAALVAFMAAALASTFHKRWRELGKLIIGGLIMGVIGFITVAPEQIAALELFKFNEGTRFSMKVGEGDWKPTGGWRIRDFSWRDVTLLTFDGPITHRFVMADNKLNHFGVPFSPGEPIVLIALIGLVVALLHHKKRRQTLAITHAVLILLFLNIFASGFFFNVAWKFYPLFDHTGTFPVVGAMLLLFIAPWFGFGVDAIARLVSWLLKKGSKAVTILSARAQTVIHMSFLSIVLTAAGAAVLFHVLVGFDVVDEWRSYFTDENVDRPALQYTFKHMLISEFEKIPHFSVIKQQENTNAIPRIYCIADSASWPSPCLDGAVIDARFQLVGQGDVAWSTPAEMWHRVNGAEAKWRDEDSLPSELLSLLRMTATEYFVTTKPADLPLVAELDWNVQPTRYEAYGYFSGNLQKARDLEWKPDYVSHLWIYRVPDTWDRAVYASTPEAEPDQNISLTTERMSPGQWRVTGHLDKAGSVILSSLWYPGWKAYVNGQSVEINRGHQFLSSVSVPAGTFDIDFIYAPLPILLGGFLMALACVSFCVWVRKRWKTVELV
ncbi:MAG: hypothetical protein WD200_01465 [Candidatus Andersenbacteria bacterium]